VASSAGQTPQQAGTTPEKALRGRVEEFYGLMQTSRWAKAEEYVTQETRENFHNSQRGPFLGFEVESVKIDPAGRLANVAVRMHLFTPYSRTPIVLPRTSRWHLVVGTWYVEAPAPPPGPEGLMTLAKQEQRPPALEFKGTRYTLGVLQPGQVKTARFPFANITDHVVTITDVLTDCECLRLKTEKKEYKPGESGELAIEFDSTGRQDFYEQTILVKTAPGGATAYLKVVCYIQLPPRKPDKAQEEKPKGLPQ
jgi:hypothetical protein